MRKLWRLLDRRGRAWLVLYLALAALVVPLACYGVIMALRALWIVAVDSGAWPVERIGACSAEVVCVVSAILTDGVPVWTAFVWMAVIVIVLLFSFRLPSVPGTPKKVAAALAAQRNEKDQRIGRALGWVLVVSSIGFMLALLFIPVTAGVVALATWSKERRDVCSADPMCVISTMPENALPVWVAFAWIAIIAAALVVCWKPSRWWFPDAEARRHVKVRTFTSPDWIRRHALIAAFISIISLYGVVGRYNEVYALDYVWAVLGALTVAAVATVCKRKYGFKTPIDVKLSLMLTMSAPGAFLDRRWRALQEELHPRKRRKPKAKANPKAKAGD